MQPQQPAGWERVEADEAQVALFELLHPEVTMVALRELYVGRAEGTTGARLFEADDELAVRSIGNNVARVHNVTTGHSALVQLSELIDAVEL